MVSTMILHLLGARNPPTRAFYLRLGVMVLLLQVWFFLIFNAFLTSGDHHKPVSPPVHHHPRDLPNMTSLLDHRHPSDLMDNVLNESFKIPHALNRRTDPYPPPWKNGFDFNAKLTQLLEENQRLFYKDRHQAQVVNPNLNYVNKTSAKTTDFKRASKLPNFQHNKEQRMSIHVENLAKNLKSGYSNEEDFKRNGHRGNLVDSNSKNIHLQHYRLSTRIPQQPWKTPSNIDHHQDFLKENVQKFSMKTSSFMKPVRNADHRHHVLQKTTTPNVILKLAKHSAEDHAESDGAKKKDFSVYLMREKEKPRLSPGCPDRGKANHVTKLAFVKVHKSASTTVANILARYALRHTLNVALPRKTPGTKRFNYFEPRITQEQILPIPQGQRYQVVFNHMIFQRSELEAFLPNDTFYFAIMRDPWDRFVSSFTYYGFIRLILNRFRLVTVKDAITFFMEHPNVVKNFTKPELYNSLAGDTGLSPREQTNIQAIKAHIQKLEKDLNLIMLVEYFDESLVMLKRKACLSMQDVVYMVKNARSRKSLTNINLTPEERVRFNRFQMADDIMYQHFYKVFWEKVHEEGPDFFLEVRQFKEIQRLVTDFCSSVSSVWDFMTVPRSVWNEEFVVTAKDCRLMRVTELDMQYHLIVRAVKLYRMSLGNDGDVQG